MDLEEKIATTTGIIAGAGLTALGVYNPELIPYIAAGAVVGSAVGAVGSAVGAVVGSAVGAVGAVVGSAVGAVGGAVGAVVGSAVGAEYIKRPVEFTKIVLTYTALSTALVLGGNFLGRHAEEVQSVTFPANSTESIILHPSEKVFYKHDEGYLPREEILERESDRLKLESAMKLETLSDKYK